MPVCVIFNPAARGNKARHFRRYLDEIGGQAALKATAAPGDARRLAAEAVGDGFDVIAAAGGDGTVNEVLNGIGDAKGFGHTRLGVLPLGTVNVFARELKIPLRIEYAWEVLRREREILIDLPQVEFTQDGSAKKQLFMQLAGAGLDARAIELVSWSHKKKLGPLAYVIAGLKALREPKPKILAQANGISADLPMKRNRISSELNSSPSPLPSPAGRGNSGRMSLFFRTIRLMVPMHAEKNRKRDLYELQEEKSARGEGELSAGGWKDRNIKPDSEDQCANLSGKSSFEGELILIGNGKFYGGSFAIFPQASLNDGLLDVCVLPRTNFGTLFRIAPELLLRLKLPEKMVKRFRAASFELSGEKTAAFQLDGEGIGHLPAKFSVAPEKLRVIA